jgi:hypothetical protein
MGRERNRAKPEPAAVSVTTVFHDSRNCSHELLKDGLSGSECLDLSRIE